MFLAFEQKKVYQASLFGEYWESRGDGLSDESYDRG